MLPFGQPAPCWLDLRDHAPVEAAALRMLMVNDRRDYQVTVADDLTRWRAGLADRAEVPIREYPGAVAAVIADWICSRVGWLNDEPAHWRSTSRCNTSTMRCS